MKSEDTVEQKVEAITGATELSAAIKVLENKKTQMEADLKSYAHSVIENLKPANILTRTFEEVSAHEGRGHKIIGAAIGIGGGYFSYKKIMSECKRVVKKLFMDVIENKSIVNHGTPVQQGSTSFLKTYMSEHKNWRQITQYYDKTKAKPEKLPKPTYWPFFLALGLMFGGWGLLSYWLFSVIGLIVFGISLFGWINDLRHE